MKPTGDYSEDELKELAQQIHLADWRLKFQHLREKFGLGVGPRPVWPMSRWCLLPLWLQRKIPRVLRACSGTPPQTGTVAPCRYGFAG